MIAESPKTVFLNIFLVVVCTLMYHQKRMSVAIQGGSSKFLSNLTECLFSYVLKSAECAHLFGIATKEGTV